MIKCFDMKGCDPACMPGEAPKLFLQQLKKHFHKRRVRGVTNLSRVLSFILARFRLYMFFAVNQVAALSKHSKARMEEVKKLLYYLVEFVNLFTVIAVA